MLLVHKTTIKVNKTYSNIIGHMCYAAYKLWNICNYERFHYKELGLTDYPNWYYQKKVHKSDLWFKQLPSQTAQEVCKTLDKSWKSFYKLQKSDGVKNPNPPRFKYDGIAITYMQNAIVHKEGSSKVRLTLSKSLKEHMSNVYNIHENFLYLENQIFKSMDVIKQIKIYPPRNGKCDVIVIYEVPNVEVLSDNGNYLSIDIGVHNFLTCLNSSTGESFIVGRKYLSICQYYYKEIARVQSQWYQIQSVKGIKHPKTSRHIQRLIAKKNNVILDYLYKMTHYIVTYCKKNAINTVIVGDITGIRENKYMGHVGNQNFHALPYKKVVDMLKYKFALEGIRFVTRKEAYSSQCSPFSDTVCKETATPEKRITRGLYADKGITWNADCVGAYNILRLYLSDQKKMVTLPPYEIKSPYIAKVAV